VKTLTFLKGALAFLLMFTMLTPMVVLATDRDPEPEQDPILDSDEHSSFANPPLWESFGFDTVYELVESFMRWQNSADLTPTMTFWRVFGASSPEELMEWYEMSEEELALIEDTWARALAGVLYELSQVRASTLEARGGTAGIVNVMFNGEFIRFGDAVPEVIDGMTFVPAAAFFGAAGWTLRFNAQTGDLMASLAEQSVRMTIGEDSAEVTADGETRNRFIEAVPFIRNGVSYIPIRPIGEIMGLHVLWDREFSAVVIIDRVGLIAEIDRNFTIMNSLLNMPINLIPTEDGTFRSVLDILLTITQFNSIDGDVHTEVDGNITLLSDGRNFSASGAINLSELIDYLIAQEMVFDISDEELAEFKEELSILNNVFGEIIFNYDAGVLYVKSPLIAEFIPQFPGNAWIEVRDLGGLVLSDIFDEFGIGYVSEITIASILGVESVGYDIVPGRWAFGRFGRITQHGEIMQNAAFYKALFGDDRFVVRGDSYTLVVAFDALVAAGLRYNHNMDVVDFDLRLTVETEGGALTGLAGAVRYREMPFFRDDILYQFEFDITAEHMRIVGETHERNVQRILFEIDLITEVADADVVIPEAPPAGAVVITLDDLLGAPEVPEAPNPSTIIRLRRILG